MYKFKATARFSSMAEGHVQKNQVLTNLTRERAYSLMAMGLGQVIEGDDTSSSFETKDGRQSSSPADLQPLGRSPTQIGAQERQPRQVGRVLDPGESSPSPASPTAGDCGQAPQPSMQPIEHGGISETSRALDTSISSETSSEDDDSPATSEPPESTSSNSSTSSGAKDSAGKKARSGPAAKSGTRARS